MLFIPLACSRTHDDRRQHENAGISDSTPRVSIQVPILSRTAVVDSEEEFGPFSATDEPCIQAAQARFTDTAVCSTAQAHELPVKVSIATSSQARDIRNELLIRHCLRVTTKTNERHCYSSARPTSSEKDKRGYFRKDRRQKRISLTIGETKNCIPHTCG